VVDVLVPDIGEGITEAFIAGWVVEIGGTVQEGQPIVELMTDKANFDVEAPVHGVLVEQCALEEERVTMNQVIARIRPRDSAA
jgi:pyruvate/2-oxoglutarate dehydrogenase complex dihydrolipoamide acyltransferase (E2) component